VKRNPTAGVLTLFLTLVVVLSAIVNIVMIQSGGIEKAGSLVLVLMYVPGVSALVTLLVRRGSLRGVGWALGRKRYLVLAVLLPILIATPVYLVVWLTGLADFDPSVLSRVADRGFGFKADPLPALGIILTVGLLQSTIAATGEEIGWRGLLFPELARKIAAPTAALATGAIWASWHYPILLFGGYANTVAPLWFSLICFTAMAISASLVIGWVRLASGSVWTAVLLHASHNLVIQAVLDTTTKGKGVSEYLTGEFGAGLAASYCIAGAIAYVALKRRAFAPAATAEAAP
jgi:membrane protease YdiL (CAAX protease family)